MNKKQSAQDLWYIWNDPDYLGQKPEVGLALYDQVTQGEAQPDWTPQERRVFLDWLEERGAIDDKSKGH
jgi:hypothetical protein